MLGKQRQTTHESYMCITRNSCGAGPKTTWISKHSHRIRTTKQYACNRQEGFFAQLIRFIVCPTIIALSAIAVKKIKLHVLLSAGHGGSSRAKSDRWRRRPDVSSTAPARLCCFSLQIQEAGRASALPYIDRWIGPVGAQGPKRLPWAIWNLMKSDRYVDLSREGHDVLHRADAPLADGHIRVSSCLQ